MKLYFGRLIILLLIAIFQPALSAPPDLPDNWLELAKQTVYYENSTPQNHVCMMKQPNLDFQEMNCWRLNIYFGITGLDLFYTDDERYRPILLGGYYGSDNADDHSYTMEAIGKHVFANVLTDSSWGVHPKYSAYRYFMNHSKQVIPNQDGKNPYVKWECFAQVKGYYHYCRKIDDKSLLH